jgi:hypothetical protein
MVVCPEVLVVLRARRKTAGGTASLPWARRPGFLGVWSAILSL